jgi:hypothetical protein
VTEAVDHNPALDLAVARIEASLVAMGPAFDVAPVYQADCRLVLNALADYRARRATGGPAPANTHSWGNVASTPETAPGVGGVCPVGCQQLCGRCTALAKETA